MEDNFEIGKQAYIKKDYSLALSHFQKVNPKDAKTLLAISNCQLGLGDIIHCVDNLIASMSLEKSPEANFLKNKLDKMYGIDTEKWHTYVQCLGCNGLGEGRFYDDMNNIFGMPYEKVANLCHFCKGVGRVDPEVSRAQLTKELDY
jgi:hypothetical protein